MRHWALGFVFGAALVLPACGGRAVGGGSSGSTEGKTDPNPTPADSSAPSSGINPDADTELGACKLGPLEESDYDKPCAWVANEHCYDTHDMACNCACPRSHDSQCISGFAEGPNGHVLVSCF
jgi:hypothetical protein